MMGRPGGRVAKRRAKTARIGFQHRVKKEDTIAWFKQRFDGIILVRCLLFIMHKIFADHYFLDRPSRRLYSCRLCVVYVIAATTAYRFECICQGHPSLLPACQGQYYGIPVQVYGYHDHGKIEQETQVEHRTSNAFANSPMWG